MGRATSVVAGPDMLHPQDVMGGLCRGHWTRGCGTTIGGVARVKVDHARVQDGSPVNGLRSTGLVL